MDRGERGQSSVEMVVLLPVLGLVAGLVLWAVVIAGLWLGDGARAWADARRQLTQTTLTAPVHVPHSNVRVRRLAAPDGIVRIEVRRRVPVPLTRQRLSLVAASEAGRP